MRLAGFRYCECVTLDVSVIASVSRRSLAARGSVSRRILPVFREVVSLPDESVIVIASLLLRILDVSCECVSRNFLVLVP